MRIPGLHLDPITLLTFLWGLSLACCPANAAAEDLYQLYQKALTHDMKFAAAQAQQLATAEKEPQSRANLLPDLSVTGGAAWVDAEDSSDYHRNRNTPTPMPWFSPSRCCAGRVWLPTTKAN